MIPKDDSIFIKAGAVFLPTVCTYYTVQYVDNRGRIQRGSYLLAAEFNPVFLERDKSPIQSSVFTVRYPPKSALDKLTVGTGIL